MNSKNQKTKRTDMRITLFSFFSSVFWSSILIIGIYFFRKMNRFKTSFGLWALVLLYLFGIVRIFLPLELPFVIELGVPHVYPQIYRFLTTSHSCGTHLHFSYFSALVFIWLFGMCLLLLRYLYFYRKALQSITKYVALCGQREYELLKIVKRGAGKEINVSLYSVPNISVPFGMGVFRKTILLPQNSFTDRELYYILLHEYTHFLNHDISVKVMVSVFCCIFWWNPIVYLLKADLEQTLEMKCDAAIAHYLDTRGKADYLRTIVSVMKQSSTEKLILYSSTTLFNANRTVDIKERFDVVMHCGTERDRMLLHIGTLFVCICVLILSYTIIPQPTFKAPTSTEPNVVDFDSSNSYIRQDNDGKYWLSIENQKPMNISDDDAKFYEKTGLRIIKER